MGKWMGPMSVGVPYSTILFPGPRSGIGVKVGLLCQKQWLPVLHPSPAAYSPFICPQTLSTPSVGPCISARLRAVKHGRTHSPGHLRIWESLNCPLRVKGPEALN